MFDLADIFSEFMHLQFQPKVLQPEKQEYQGSWQSDKTWKQADIMTLRESLKKSGKFERKKGKLGKSQRIFIFGTQDVFLLL